MWTWRKSRRVSRNCRTAVRHGQSTHWIAPLVTWRKPVPSERRLPTTVFKIPLLFMYIATTVHIIDGDFRPRFGRNFVRMRQPPSKAHQVRSDRGEFAGLNRRHASSIITYLSEFIVDRCRASILAFIKYFIYWNAQGWTDYAIGNYRARAARVMIVNYFE